MLPVSGETYAPVGKLTPFRYLTGLAASYRLAINHLDVTAFLNPHVDDPELYTEIPNGWDSAYSDCNSGDGLQQRRQQAIATAANATAATVTAVMATVTAATATAATATATTATASRLERSYS